MKNPGVTFVQKLNNDFLHISLKVSGTDTRKWLNDLMPFLIELLGDGTSGWKRHVGLVTLGKLIENTGYVIRPYKEYPALLDILLSFIKTEQQPIVR